jgi:DNA replication protein DnaC
MRCALAELRGLERNAKTLPEVLTEHVESSRPHFAFSAADVEWMMARATAWQADRDEQRRRDGHRHFAEAVGPRFAAATLESYRVVCIEQRKALDALLAYRDNIKERAAAGAGIIMFGVAGSGKTHLLVGMGEAAIDAGFDVKWRNGVDLAAEFRSTISGRRSEDDDEGVTEEDVVTDLASAEILILDDVLPPSGTLSEYQSGNLYRILNRRYNDCRPTWASMNVASGEEAERGAGCQNIDRLRHGALTLFCGWESYRKAQG